jgi:hypothetical protein
MLRGQELFAGDQMRRITQGALSFVVLLAGLAPPLPIGRSGLGMVAAAWAQNSEPPHAWLFGAWTGGIFPAPTQLTAQSCLAQPTVIFTRDLVLRSTLTEPTYAQRQIATVRATSSGFEFRFEPAAPVQADPSNGLLGLPSGGGGINAVGFGCESLDALHVERHGENEISFPGCADFPDPLVRCPAQ